MGEQIDVELRFQAGASGRYRVFSTGIDRRYARDPEYDRLVVEPVSGVRDPLFDSGTIMSGGFGRPPFNAELGPSALTVDSIVNDWVSFTKPGTYRVRAESTRVFQGGPQKPEPVKLTSNWITIEIVAPEASWREQQLRTAIAALDRTGAAENPEAIQRGARVLRFLETREAVPHLVRLFEQGPQAAQQDIRAGLLASPHRAEVIATMEQAIEAPDFPVTYYWLGTLMQLEYARRFGPRGEPMPREDPEALKRWMEEDRRYMERFQPIQELYKAKLAGAIGRKRGAARGASLESLLAEGTAKLPAELRAVLATDLAALPATVQLRLLALWPRIAGPDLEPALREVARKPGMARDRALEYLIELNPSAARTIVIDRIKRGDLGDPRRPTPRALLFLEEERLPEIEDALIAALDKSGFAGSLLSRYATNGAAPRVSAWLADNPQAICYNGISGYMFRADPAYASRLLGEARKTQPSCAPYFATESIALLISPGLERVAIEDLTNPNQAVRRAAQTLLQAGGSAAAEQALWDGFSILREQPAAPLDFGLETGYVDALIQGCGWVLSPKKLDAVEGMCLTPNCRQFAHSQRRFLDRPVEITIHSEGPWRVMIGGCLTFTRDQAQQRIRRFPPGTVFRLPGGARTREGGFYPQRLGLLWTMLKDAGMKVSDNAERHAGASF